MASHSKSTGNKEIKDLGTGKENPAWACLYRKTGQTDAKAPDHPRKAPKS
jgi:hypothetical protein